MPWLRRNTNTIGRRMFSDALGLYVSDNQTGYRLVSARLMQAMLGSRETNFEFEVEMIVVCVLSGFQMGGVSIKTITQVSTATSNPFGTGIILCGCAGNLICAERHLSVNGDNE